MSICQHNVDLITKEGRTYRYGSEGHYHNWHLTQCFSISTFMGWEPALKAMCKEEDPSSEEHVTDNRDDTSIMIGL
jgi:hypothetical protein